MNCYNKFWEEFNEREGYWNLIFVIGKGEKGKVEEDWNLKRESAYWNRESNNNRMKNMYVERIEFEKWIER